MRPRGKRPTPGTGIGVREAAREYKVDDSVIRYQVGKGIIKKVSDGMLDAASVWDWYTDYTPHTDNRSRRHRTIPELAAASPATARTPVPGAALAPRPVFHQAQAPASVYRQAATGAPVLSTREWWGKFEGEQRRAMGGSIRFKTQESYDQTSRKFIAKFPALPMDAPAPALPTARKAIIDWLAGLRNEKSGEKLGPTTVLWHLKILKAFYHWLHREYGYAVPDLSRPSLPPENDVKEFFTTEEIRRLLRRVRNHDEYTFIVVMAQTGCRRGELCSLNPDDPRRIAWETGTCRCCGPQRRKGAEMLTPREGGGGWAHIYGKPTRVNLMGRRVIYLAEESFEALARHLRYNGRVSWNGQPLTEDRLSHWLNALTERTGMKRLGKNTHAFRRAFEGEFEANGGSVLMMNELLGHYTKKDMLSLYYNVADTRTLDAMCLYAPREFLRKDPPATGGIRAPAVAVPATPSHAPAGVAAA